MGLFSSKNKRDRAAEDSGRFYSKDDDAAIGERARAKRASSAGASPGAGAGKSTARRQASDPMLPEKKRARRRLVGAIALALAAAVGLPMLLDSSPKPLAGDIAIQIPSKDKAPALPVPAAPADAGEGDAAAPAAPAASAPAKAAAAATPHDRSVTAADSVDRGEEVLAAPPPAKPEPRRLESKPEPKPEHKEARAEHRDAPRPEHKDGRADTRVAEKADWAEKGDKADKIEKPARPRLELKPAKPHDDTTRALAILEGKASDSKAEAPAAQKSVLQVAAMSSPEKAAEVQARLRGAGISSYTEKSAGGLIRVKVAFSKDEAEKVRATLARLGL